MYGDGRRDALHGHSYAVAYGVEGELDADGLLVDFLQNQGARVIVRGLRAVSDFEYEFQMALMNRRLAASIETVYLMPAETYTYLSSRLVREVAYLGGSVKGLVPEEVVAALDRRYGRRGS